MPSSLAHSASGRSSPRRRRHSACSAGDVPLLGQRVFRDRARDHRGDRLVAHVGDGGGDVARIHDLAALLVDDLALVVHHVVVFEELLADIVVARLDLLLRLGERLVDPGVDDRLAFLEAEPLQHRIHPLGAEDPHQIVFERDEEFGGAGVALAAGAAAQLVVDAAALMPLAADDEERRRPGARPRAPPRSRRGSRRRAPRARPGPRSSQARLLSRISRLPPS